MNATAAHVLPSVEVMNISIHGIWLFVNDAEFFLPYSEYPWFEDATIKQIVSVELHSDTHLFWPLLDIDLSIDILKQPENYPLVSSN